MKLRILTVVTAVITLVGSVTPVYPHTTVSGTTPVDGAVLDVSPPVIEIRFEHAARLTSVVLIQEGKPERRLIFTPESSSTTFEIPEPNLGTGENEILWKALSGDGHVISDILIYTIKTSPAAAD